MREDIAKWLEALRSGEYKQTKGVLEFNGGFCCLGVYCKVNNIRYTLAFEDPDQEFGVNENNLSVYDKLRSILDDSVFNHDVISKGIDMNDYGKSFAEIANMIEEHYKK